MRSQGGLNDITNVATRRAGPSDCDAIAEAHRDSIRSVGPMFYPPEVVEAWQHGLRAEVYLKAMERGEVFFIATGTVDGTSLVLGFASDYRIEGSKHGSSVYVRGNAGRRGLGSALLRLAEEHAVVHGAATIHIEASLAGAEFYKRNGYIEIGRGNTHLTSGTPIACVFMQKRVAAGGGV